MVTNSDGGIGSAVGFRTSTPPLRRCCFWRRWLENHSSLNTRSLKTLQFPPILIAVGIGSRDTSWWRETDSWLTESLQNLDSARKSSLVTSKEELISEKRWAKKAGFQGLLDNFLNSILTFPTVHIHLKDFHKETIYHLQDNFSIFVIARTFKDRMVVVNHVFDLSKKHQKKVIQTSKWEGIVRLSSMMYNMPIIKKKTVACLEEILILLPDHVNMLFLSTPIICNVYDFADCIGFLKKKKIFVATQESFTIKHHLYCSGKLHTIFDAGEFLQGALKEVRTGTFSGSRKPENVLIRKLKSENFLPVVLFCSCMDDCEKLAIASSSDRGLITSSDRMYIENACNANFNKLDCSIRCLKQLREVKRWLRRGIGVYHDGLLPIVMELVETLFSGGYIKVLLATKAFMMGADVPEHTETERCSFLMEDTISQRDMDQVKSVIIMCGEDIPEDGYFESFLSVTRFKIEAKFSVTYKLMLHLLSIRIVELNVFRNFSRLTARGSISDGIGVEDLIKYCLHNIKPKLELLYGTMKTPTWNERMDCLKHLNYVDARLSLQPKGHVALKLFSCDVLLATEYLIRGHFLETEATEIAAFISALVYKGDNSADGHLLPPFQRAREKMMETAVWLGSILAKHKVIVDPQEYAYNALDFTLVEAVHKWAKGNPFNEVCEITSVPPGLVLRTLVNIVGTCEEFSNAITSFSQELHQKFETAVTSVRRGIVEAELKRS